MPKKRTRIHNLSGIATRRGFEYSCRKAVDRLADSDYIFEVLRTFYPNGIKDMVALRKPHTEDLSPPEQYDLQSSNLLHAYAVLEEMGLIVPVMAPNGNTAVQSYYINTLGEQVLKRLDPMIRAKWL